MADKNLDEYQPLKFYKKNSKARQNGFAKFKDEKSHYFALYKDGDIAMLSQAYVNAVSYTHLTLPTIYSV